jgi:hypothetical protein
MPSPRHPLIQKASEAAWAPPVPNDHGSFETDALFEAYKFIRGRNHAWECPACHKTGHGVTRLEVHSESHFDMKNYKPLHEAQFAPKIAKKAKTEPATVLEPGQMTLPDMMQSRNIVQSKLNRAVARFVVVRSEPYNVVEDDAFVDMIQAAMDAGKVSTLCARDLLVGRTSMTHLAGEVASEAFSALRARLFGPGIMATLTLDGRMSVRKQPLLVANAETRDGFLPLGAFNPGSARKDAEYLVKLTASFMADKKMGAGVGERIVAVTMDGAAVNMAALRRIKSELHLVPVRCQSHRLSLLCQHLLTGPFNDLRTSVDTLVALLVNNNRVFNLFAEKSNGSTIVRPAGTRFGSYFYVLHNLHKHQEHIKAVLVSSAYADWLRTDATVNAVKNNGIIDTAGVLKPAFWTKVRDCRDLLLPVIQALRLVDQTRIRPSTVYKLWRVLSEKLVASMESSDFDLATKKHVCQLFLHDMEKGESDVLVAAHMLDPVEREWMVAQAANRTRDYVTLRTKTVDVLKLLCTRCFGHEADEKFDDVSSELDNYLTSTHTLRQFRPERDTHASWFMQLGILGLLATIIHDVKVTISDVERVNKVYAYTQTPERNRLLLDNVNTLVKGRLAIKTDQRGPIGTDTGVFEFVDDAERVYGDTSSYLKSLIAADKAYTAMAKVEEEGNPTDRAAAPMAKDVKASWANRVTEATAQALTDEAADAVAAEANSPLIIVGDQGEEVIEEEEVVEVQGDFEPVPVPDDEDGPRRSSRRVYVPERFKRALTALGLRGYDQVLVGPETDD